MSCGDENVKSVKVQEEYQKNALKDHFYRLHFVMFQINMFLEYESRTVKGIARPPRKLKGQITVLSKDNENLKNSEAKENR